MTFLDGLTDQLLAAVLEYGYPALGLALLLGAIGIPIPSGMIAAVAGALVAQGYLSLEQTAVVALAGLIVGDLLTYGIGRWAGEQFLHRHGRWLGITPSGVARAIRLFDRWGGISVLLTSSLITVLSTPVRLLAGASRYRMHRFLPLNSAGRVVWTALYVGAGYSFSASVEEVTQFMGDVSGLVGSLLVLVTLAAVLVRQGRRRWGKPQER